MYFHDDNYVCSDFIFEDIKNISVCMSVFLSRFFRLDVDIYTMIHRSQRNIINITLFIVLYIYLIENC